MSKANSTSNHKCIHQPQCISRYPKDPPSRIWNNGDGLTVLLPNWSSKSEIEKYETAFGEHSCKDCNTETIIFETGGMATILLNLRTVLGGQGKGIFQQESSKRQHS